MQCPGADGIPFAFVCRGEQKHPEQASNLVFNTGWDNQKGAHRTDLRLRTGNSRIGENVGFDSGCGTDGRGDLLPAVEPGEIDWKMKNNSTDRSLDADCDLQKSFSECCDVRFRKSGCCRPSA